MNERAVTASQNYRDGAATGANQLAARIKVIQSYGVALSNRNLDDLVAQLGEEWGGSIDKSHR